MDYFEFRDHLNQIKGKPTNFSQYNISAKQRIYNTHRKIDLCRHLGIDVSDFDGF
jgi:hypothetical protein